MLIPTDNDLLTWIGRDEGQWRRTGRTLATVVPGYWSSSCPTGDVAGFVALRRTRHVHEFWSGGHRSGSRRKWHYLMVGRTVSRVARMPPRHLPQVQVPRVNILAVLKNEMQSFRFFYYYFNVASSFLRISANDSNITLLL